MFSALRAPSVDTMACCVIAVGMPLLVGVRNDDPNIEYLLTALAVMPLVSTACNYFIGTAEQLKNSPCLAMLSDCLQRAAQAVITFYGFKMMNENMRHILNAELGVVDPHINKVLARTILSAYGPMLGSCIKAIKTDENFFMQFCATLVGNSVKYYNTPTDEAARHSWGVLEYIQVAAAGSMGKVLIYSSINMLDKKVSPLGLVQKSFEGMLNYIVYNLLYHDQVPPAHKLPTFMFVKAMEEVHKTAVSFATKALQNTFAAQVVDNHVDAGVAR